MNNYQNNYAYKILSDELRMLRKVIKTGNFEGYETALKDRIKKCYELQDALKLIEEKNGAIYKNSNYPTDFILNPTNQKGFNVEDICKELGIVKKMKTISVSKVIQETKGWRDKEALEIWKERVGLEKALQIQKEAQERGKKLDADFEEYHNNGSSKNNSLNNYLKGHTITIREYKLELTIDDNFTLVGRLDSILDNNLLIDFKTSSKLKKSQYIEDYYLQLGAYYFMLKHLKPEIKIEKAQIPIFIEGHEKPQIFRMNNRMLEGYQEKFIDRLEIYLDSL